MCTRMDDSFTFNETNVGNCGTTGSTCIAMTQCVLPTAVCLRIALPMSDVYADDSFTFDKTNKENCGTAGLTCIAIRDVYCRQWFVSKLHYL